MGSTWKRAQVLLACALLASTVAAQVRTILNVADYSNVSATSSNLTHVKMSKDGEMEEVTLVLPLTTAVEPANLPVSSTLASTTATWAITDRRVRHYSHRVFLDSFL
jgi:hypothetical protein